MMIRKDLVTAILPAFCLTTALFMIVPTSGVHPYDQWVDINGDEVIDITDVAMTADAR